MNLLTTAQKWNDAGIATIPIGFRAKNQILQPLSELEA
jgi:hypothetical protein